MRERQTYEHKDWKMRRGDSRRWLRRRQSRTHDQEQGQQEEKVNGKYPANNMKEKERQEKGGGAGEGERTGASEQGRTTI